MTREETDKQAICGELLDVLQAHDCDVHESLSFLSQVIAGLAVIHAENPDQLVEEIVQDITERCQELRSKLQAGLDG
jgi:hypothetical protein